MAVKKSKPKKKIVKKKPVKRAAKKKVSKRKPVRKPVRKLVKKSAPKASKAKAVKKPKQDVIGIVTHYFPHVNAAVIKLKAPLSVGDKIQIKGHTTDFTENITSLQIDRVAIQSAKKGDEIGLLVSSRVRQHDMVYKAK